MQDCHRQAAPDHDDASVLCILRFKYASRAFFIASRSSGLSSASSSSGRMSPQERADEIDGRRELGLEVEGKDSPAEEGCLQYVASHLFLEGVAGGDV